MRFLRIINVDIYVTGSNSRFLSSDIVTEFRGRGDELRIYPLQNFIQYMMEIMTMPRMII
ncbi:MAG: AAA family ATPase [Erysipelotrichaceae bacterium]|nr:AAA family ATPase [Erysipelotrichaceae bacterium]